MRHYQEHNGNVAEKKFTAQIASKRKWLTKH